MKKIMLSLAILFTLAGVFAFTLAQSWKIANNYSIKFSSSDASGIFKTFKGTIVFDEQNPATSKFDVTIDVASINTGNGLQNKHAKEEEWFDATKYPTIKFTSKKIVKSGAAYQVTGDLEIKGVKKETTLPFTFKAAGAAGTFAGTFNVNRNDFHVGKPGGDVADVIKIDVSVPVTK
ncbi:MAG: YceI family protein [Chitinophagaceae bacterium]